MNSHHYCKKYIFSILLIGLFSFFINLNIGESYYFGLKSSDNTPQNIIEIEKTTGVKLPIVSFIFDPREKSNVLNSIDEIVYMLGTDRIYHFTISPDNYSAEEVVLGKFDDQYLSFFKKIKEKNLHVIFRTMHEMNGGWYPRSSNPGKFKEARIHVRNLSREAGLNNENIAFDFSINHRDMPTKGKPSQNATLIECPAGKKNCYHFEDYYPGDEYVDIVGLTFYNRGKAVGNRLRLSPSDTLENTKWKTYERLKAFNKPIIIDEVATTNVRYEGPYSYEKSLKEYRNHDKRKDLRLGELLDFILTHQEIISAIYFNVDYTAGLSFRITGEADRAIINLNENRVYSGFFNLEYFGEKDLTNILTNLFKTEFLNIDGLNVIVSPYYSEEIKSLYTTINEKANNLEEKIELIKNLQNINIKSDKTKKALEKLLESYTIIYENQNL